MDFSILLQQGPANTTAYMWLGFGVIFGVIGIHILSLYSRAGRLKKDLALLKELEDKE
jgi:hypothetical protein